MNQLEKFEDRVLSVLESNTQSRSDDMVLYLLVCNSYSNNENPIRQPGFSVAPVVWEYPEQISSRWSDAQIP